MIIPSQITVKGNTTGHVPARPDYEDLVTTEESAHAHLGLPREVELASGGAAANLNFSQVDEALLELSEDDKSHLDVLKQQLLDEEITEKGFRIKREKLLKSYVRRYLVNRGGSLKDLVKQEDLAIKSEVPAKTVDPSNDTDPANRAPNARAVDPAKAALASKSTNDTKISMNGTKIFATVNRTSSRNLLWSGRDSLGEAAAFIEELNRSPTRRRLLDAYGDSLLTVNRLYSERYGHANRKIPSHMVSKEVLYWGGDPSFRRSAFVGWFGYFIMSAVFRHRRTLSTSTSSSTCRASSPRTGRSPPATRSASATTCSSASPTFTSSW